MEECRSKQSCLDLLMDDSVSAALITINTLTFTRAATNLNEQTCQLHVLSLASSHPMVWPLTCQGRWGWTYEPNKSGLSG